MSPPKDLSRVEQVFRQLSLQDGLQLSSRLPLSSQYQCNYQPFERGVRKGLWEEGFHIRNVRKKEGFKHTKLEWKVLTDRQKR